MYLVLTPRNLSIVATGIPTDLEHFATENDYAITELNGATVLTHNTKHLSECQIFVTPATKKDYNDAVLLHRGQFVRLNSHTTIATTHSAYTTVEFIAKYKQAEGVYVYHTIRLTSSNTINSAYASALSQCGKIEDTIKDGVVIDAILTGQIFEKGFPMSSSIRVRDGLFTHVAFTYEDIMVGKYRDVPHSEFFRVRPPKSHVITDTKRVYLMTHAAHNTDGFVKLLVCNDTIVREVVINAHERLIEAILLEISNRTAA